MLKNLASHLYTSRGRLYEEKPDAFRTPFQRDKDRILRSTAFRRLQYKTQVFVNHEGDHYRTRLTHSLEVAQIAKTICRMLELNEDLSEALALAHDMGHPPFGHAGEDALNLKMKPFGGFDHNGHTIKLITELEQQYANFDGLNLCWETIEGIAKHNGPLTGVNAVKNKIVPSEIENYSKKHNLELDRFSSLEAQIASVADDIAYNNHDLEDGIRSGYLTINDIEDLPIINQFLFDLRKQFDDVSDRRLIHELIRKMINLMVNDVVNQINENVKTYKINSAEDVRNCTITLVNFSDEIEEYNKLIRKLLMAKVYRHYKVNSMSNIAKRVIGSLFDIYYDQPNCLPPEWLKKAKDGDNNQLAIVIADFISGMTDRFAIATYKDFHLISY